MRLARKFLISTALITVASMAVIGHAAQSAAQTQSAPAAAPAAYLTLSTAAFPDGTEIPAKFTQGGDQTSPALTWTNVPAGTVSFVLHLHDPDVSRNGTTDDQLHWLVWNIPGNATGLPEGIPKGPKLENGAYQLSASGQIYRGPGANARMPRHHYTFELYALDAKVDVEPGTDAFETRARVMKAIQGHILGKAIYVGLYHLPK